MAESTGPGPKSLPFTVIDAEGRSGSGSIDLTVIPAADPCLAADQPIGAVQTAGATGLSGRRTVQGVVVGDYEGDFPASAWLLRPGRR